MKYVWVRVITPMRRVWIRVAARIRMRKSGLMQLKKEVNTCEYEDVRIMWEMLNKTDAKSAPLLKRLSFPKKGEMELRHIFGCISCTF